MTSGFIGERPQEIEAHRRKRGLAAAIASPDRAVADAVVRRATAVRLCQGNATSYVLARFHCDRMHGSEPANGISHFRRSLKWFAPVPLHAHIVHRAPRKF